MLLLCWIESESELYRRGLGLLAQLAALIWVATQIATASLFIEQKVCCRLRLRSSMTVNQVSLFVRYVIFHLTLPELACRRPDLGGQAVWPPRRG